ncbi:MAG: hypothetical protein BA863_05605 [Desulfovibrio sp. S3730MH75]|nr:MAG: hypothetical protein BA863_05605 [Desulfovibrio sp. S3730MH75]
MRPTKRLTKSEGFASEVDRRKRLGQFFTGVGLGKILAALSFAKHASSIVDPMAGSGDLLSACLDLGARPKTVGAIEIDPVAYEVCRNRLVKSSCVLGNAFDPAVLARLPRCEWDLVITNPPYVRYQSMAKGAGLHFKLPGAVEVRNGLMAALDGMTALNEKDRELFRALVSGYSGLADLAVPSLILCASMVSVGGRLALVVPESWLSRNYAAVVHYLLLRWFHIEHIVDDEHAVWFEDAQVKTTLLIARRVERRSGAFDWGDGDMFVRARVSGKAMGPGGPVARLFPGKKNSEELFAVKVRKVLESNSGFEEELTSASLVSLGRVANNLKRTCSKQKWLSVVGEKASSHPETCCVPLDFLERWLGEANSRTLVSLADLGVSIGQGLRTGANGFFYSRQVFVNKKEALVIPDGVPGVNEVMIPLYCLRTVVRRQSELPEGFAIHNKDLMGRVLDLRAQALAEDIKEGGDLVKKLYTPMPKSLAVFVRKAAHANFGTTLKPKRIIELSAVAPNIRKGNPVKGIPPRFWYMLPDFTPRHAPALLVPRVNGGTPKAWIVADSGVLVDANFSTLNVQEGTGLDVYAVLAFLNSTWCRVVLEHTASVMGGGALKVEATHLRRIPVPQFEDERLHHLSKLGRRLAENGSGLEEIDQLVASALLGRTAKQEETAALSRLAEEGRIRRGRKKEQKGV